MLLLGLLGLLGTPSALGSVWRVDTVEHGDGGTEADDFAFGPATFSRRWWIGGGRAFSGVRHVEVEMETPGAFALELVGASGAVLSTARAANTDGGWSVFHFPASLQPPISDRTGPYRLRLVVVGSGTRKLRQGTVYFH